MNLGDLWQISLLENTIEQYTAVFLIILLTFIFAKLLFYIFKTYFQHYARKTKTGFGDALIKCVSGPLVWFFIAIGVYYAVGILTLPKTFTSLLNIMLILSLTLIITSFILRIINTFIVFYFEPFVKESETKFDDQLLPILKRTINLFIIFMAIIIALNNLGYNVSSLLAGLGIGGLAVALAAQETIGNFFGSVSIFADKIFEVGDQVKIGEVRGAVKEVGLRSTRIETGDGTIVTIPNSKIANDKIENMTQNRVKKIAMTIGITYNADSKKLEKAVLVIKNILKHAAQKKLINKEYSVFFVNFGTYTLDLQVMYLTPKILYEDWAKIQHDINIEIKKAFDQNKIEFIFPAQTLYVKKRY